VSTRGLGRARSAALLVLVLLAGVLALAWQLRGTSPAPVLEARPEARAEETTTAELAPDARIAEPEPLAIAEAERAIFEPVAPSAEARVESVNVRVVVLGLPPEERATIEVLLVGEGERVLVLELRETDEHGRLELALPHGRLRLSAWTKEQIAPAARVEVRDRPIDIEMQLAPAARITGRVTNAASGAPIAGARVRLQVESKLRTELSGANGDYAFTVQADGTVRSLDCTAEGFAFESCGVGVRDDGSWWFDPPGLRGPEHELAPRPAPAIVDFELWPARTIRGEVRGASGPLEGASILARGHVYTGMSLASPDEARSASTPNGSFELSGLRPDIGHVLSIEHSGYAKTQLLVPPSAAPRVELGVLRLDAESHLEVRVVDGDGVAVEGVNLVLDAPLALPAGMERASKLLFPRDPGFEDGRKRNERSDGDGRASFRALAAGSYTLVLRGYPLELVKDPIEIRAGELVNFELELPTTATITGLVLGAHGPIAGARVEINRMGGRFTLSDAQGRFSFAGLIDGTSHHVHATWTDTAGQKQSTDSVEAKPGATVELRARDTR